MYTNNAYLNDSHIDRKDKSNPLIVVRFAISEDSYESIITNLPKEDFPVEEIKKVYAMRWGIETSFRELKYAIGLCCFHSKKVEYIMQEIYARLILYNYCELITMHVIIQQKGTKHVYQMNYTIAIHICRYFLRNDISPPDVETLIQKNLLPVRPGRSDPRKSTHPVSHCRRRNLVFQAPCFTRCILLEKHESVQTTMQVFPLFS